MNGGSSSLIQFCRDHKINRCATVLEVNSDVRRLVELVRKLRLDQKLLLRQTREFSKLVFNKLALESSLGITSPGNSDIQVLKILLGRTKAVSRYLDPQAFSSVKNSPTLLSWAHVVETSKSTKCSRMRMLHVYVSRRSGRKRLVELQAEHLRLNRSSYGVKQLLLRFDEDNALLRNDVELLRQSPPALDSVQALDTWTKLARVELCFMSGAEKRRSIASQRRMSALSARRLSMTGNRHSLRDSTMYSGIGINDSSSANRVQDCDLDAYQDNLPRTRRPATEPSHHRPSQNQPGAFTNGLGRQNQENQDAELSKRISILSLGKRSGAILTDWKWDGEYSDDEKEPESIDAVIAEHSGDPVCASISTTSNSSANTSSLDNRSRNTKASSEESLSNSKPIRPRSFIAPRNRYSMYDQYGRKKVPAGTEFGLSKF